MIDLPSEYLAQVEMILAEHVPGLEVRAFGSRVQGGARPYSDLDLAVAGPVDSHQLQALRDAFADSNLPFQVDVLDWHATSPSFQKVIQKQYEVVQKAKNESLASG
jgi:uncharacterized protein